MPSDHHPQAALDLRTCARHLVQQPLTCKEHDSDLFRLIRRHEGELDRWFTQRFGYRLHVDGDTARLFKDGFVPERRPLLTARARAFHSLEYVLLALVLAATVAGPAVISLRDLVEKVRSAAVEADIALDDSPSARRALVSVLQWMIMLGLATELHARIDAYAGDESADAVLKIRPDRIALLALPALAGTAGAEELLSRAERRGAMRQWMRCRLVEEPVLYRTDVNEVEWSELRRRLGEEERLLGEMFGLEIEARAEGVAAIDRAGTLAQRRFPAGGTVGHATLLLIERLGGRGTTPCRWKDLVDLIGELAARQRGRWANDLVEAPARLARQVTELMVELRLGEWVVPGAVAASATSADADASVAADRVAAQGSEGEAPSGDYADCDDGSAVGEGRRGEQPMFRLLPAAARFLPSEGNEIPREGAAEQESLW